MADEKQHDNKQDEPSQESQDFQQLLKGALAALKDELVYRSKNVVNLTSLGVPA